MALKMDMSWVENIYVIHAKKGYEYHEQRIIELFAKNNMPFEFVTDGDPSNFTDALINKYFISDVAQKLSNGLISCTLNHFFAYENIVKRENKYALVFENDPFFLGNFPQKLNALYEEIQSLESGFIVSLENSTLRFPSYFQTKKKKLLYQASEGRMAGAYLIDLQGARNVLEDLKSSKCGNIIDWWVHNNLIKRNVVRMYWAQPPLVEQGSHNGKLSSTISSKSKSLSRKVSWFLLKNWQFYVNRLFKEKRIISK